MKNITIQISPAEASALQSALNMGGCWPVCRLRQNVAARIVREYLIAPVTPAVRTCRVCGCTEDNACVTLSGPCHWVSRDLCSACFTGTKTRIKTGTRPAPCSASVRSVLKPRRPKGKRP